MTGAMCADCADRKGNVCKAGNRMVYELDECPAGYTQEEIDKAQAVSTKVKVDARADKPRKTTTRKPKEDPEKEEIINYVAAAMESFTKSTRITNKTKVIEFDIGENHYKLDLTRSRKPKN